MTHPAEEEAAAPVAAIHLVDPEPQAPPAACPDTIASLDGGAPDDPPTATEAVPPDAADADPASNVVVQTDELAQTGELAQADEAEPVTPELTALRRYTARTVSDRIALFGEYLWTAADPAGDPCHEGIALVTQMVGQLGQGAVETFSHGRWYAGTTLVRQLIEMHYLLAHFAEDPRQVARWLRASTSRIERAFQAEAMRRAGGFLESEYKIHRAWAGHPSPSAGWLLPSHQPFIHPELLWVDLVQHLADAAVAMFDCLRLLPDSRALTITHRDLLDELADAIHGWHEVDPVADRFVIDVDGAEAASEPHQP